MEYWAGNPKPITPLLQYSNTPQGLDEVGVQ